MNTYVTVPNLSEYIFCLGRNTEEKQEEGKKFQKKVFGMQYKKEILLHLLRIKSDNQIFINQNKKVMGVLLYLICIYIYILKQIKIEINTQTHMQIVNSKNNSEISISPFSHHISQSHEHMTEHYGSSDAGLLLPVPPTRAAALMD